MSVKIGDPFYISSIGAAAKVVPNLSYDYTGGSAFAVSSGTTGIALGGLGLSNNSGSGGLFTISNVRRWNGSEYAPVTSGTVNYRDIFVVRSIETEVALGKQYVANGNSFSNLTWWNTIGWMGGIYAAGNDPPSSIDDVAAVLQSFSGTNDPSAVQIVACSKSVLSDYSRFDTSVYFFIQKIGSGGGDATGPINYNDQFAIVSVCDIVGSGNIGNSCSCTNEILPALVAPPGAKIVKLVQDSAICSGCIHWDTDPQPSKISFEYQCTGTPATEPIPPYDTGTLSSDNGGPTKSFTWSFSKHSYNPVCNSANVVATNRNSVCTSDPSQTTTDPACVDGLFFSGCDLTSSGGMCLASRMTDSHTCFTDGNRYVVNNSDEMVWLFNLPSGMWFMNSYGTLTKIERPKYDASSTISDQTYGQNIRSDWGAYLYVTSDGNVFQSAPGSTWVQLKPVQTVTGTNVQGANQYMGPPDPYGGPRLAYARYPPMPGMTLPCLPTGGSSALHELQAKLCSPTDPTIGGTYKVGVQVKNWSSTKTIHCLVDGQKYTVAPGQLSDIIETQDPTPGSPPYQSFAIMEDGSSEPFYTQATTEGPYVLPSFRVGFKPGQFSVDQPQDGIVDVDPDKKYVQGYYMVYLGSGSSNQTVVQYFKGLRGLGSKSSLEYQQEIMGLPKDVLIIGLIIVVIIGILVSKKM